MNQYGTEMEMRVNESGVYFDNRKSGALTIRDLNINPESRILLRLSVPKDNPASRGLTIFGKGYGNHNSGMILHISFGV
jgi:predicted transcriptional regulator